MCFASRAWEIESLPSKIHWAVDHSSIENIYVVRTHPAGQAVSNAVRYHVSQRIEPPTHRHLVCVDHVKTLPDDHGLLAPLCIDLILNVERPDRVSELLHINFVSFVGAALRGVSLICCTVIHFKCVRSLTVPRQHSLIRNASSLLVPFCNTVILPHIWNFFRGLGISLCPVAVLVAKMPLGDQKV